MSKKTSHDFKQEDKKIIDIFTDLGMPKNLAKTLLYVSKVDECRSADIERGADLRQPEVSVAMQKLRDRGWIEERHKKKEGKGRPVHLYKLSAPIADIIENFEEEKMEEVNTIQNDLNELKNLIDKKT
ncbi:MAG: ArsR family transcriptional regulator [Candidatus Thermoplasmatota archaeon]